MRHMLLSLTTFMSEQDPFGEPSARAHARPIDKGAVGYIDQEAVELSSQQSAAYLPSC